jgi:iron complex transport system ATP-binding protein
MLEISGLTVRLGGVAVLQGLSLAARAGQVLAICGPNGAGKSTLLRAALGEEAMAGQVRLNGQDVARARPDVLARMRAVLPQDTQVAFAFTVAEIVAMGCEAGGHDASGATRALAAVGLASRAGRDIQTLSGGERQRVHLARALAQVGGPLGPEGPRWLFLDEPVASLDLGHQLQVMRLARGFADAGGGVVAVMHDLNLSAMFADRMVMLLDGRILSEGTPDQVLREEVLDQAYGCRIALNTAPDCGPWFVPQAVRI